MYYILHFYLVILVVHYCYAGELEPRVYDGENLRPYVHSYLVQLRKMYKAKTNNSLYTTSCSGSILNHRWIISAAHCFRDNLIHVEVDKYFFQILGYVDKDQITIYPGFKYEKKPRNSILEKDLALLKTRKHIKFDLFTKPISLSKRSPKIGEAVMIAGYGDAEHGLMLPREGNTTVGKCEDSKSNVICTQSTVRAGPGDSGGALVSRGKLVGVISASCEDVEKHQVCETVYVDIALHLEWIKGVLSNSTKPKL